MSEVKVNKISPRAACGTVTFGDSGDTFTIPAGVTITNNGTQTGFGREGSVNWQTGSIKTGNFSATNGEGYFINSSSPITMSLPAGSAGAIVAVSDYARNFSTHNFTIAANGSEKIGGETNDAILNVDGQAATFVYVDSTKGWINVQNAEDTETGASPYIQATGGTQSDDGDFRVHKFTGPGTFSVSAISNVSTARNTAALLVVGGGGAGGARLGGGGGAGGLREFKTDSATPYTSAPGIAACSGIVLTAQAYPIQVGGGGPGAPSSAKAVNPGVNSSGLGKTSAGGGGGGAPCTPAPNNPQPTNQGAGDDGGSGGGVSDMRTNTAYKGAGNVPAVNPPQGNDGGMGVDFPPSAGGGGGGFGAAGTTAPSPGSSPSPGQAGPGGAGGATSITGSPVTYAGGGGGGIQPGYTAGTGGTGGGGAGRAGPGAGTAGTAETGGGGGGGGTPCGTGGNGGGGVVIIRYKFQN
jgi:hypothetical protein